MCSFASPSLPTPSTLFTHAIGFSFAIAVSGMSYWCTILGHFPGLALGPAVTLVAACLLACFSMSPPLPLPHVAPSFHPSPLPIQFPPSPSFYYRQHTRRTCAQPPGTTSLPSPPPPPLLLLSFAWGPLQGLN